MATCPRCGRYLDVHHRCVGLWRLRLGVLRVTLVGAAAGAGVGWALMTLVFGNASWLSIAVTALVGAVTARAALRGSPSADRRSR